MPGPKINFHYRWVMRPELCQALETMRWVKPVRTDHPDDDLYEAANDRTKLEDEGGSHG